jgi:hypothetical protein
MTTCMEIILLKLLYLTKEKDVLYQMRQQALLKHAPEKNKKNESQTSILDVSRQAEALCYEFRN